MEIEIMVFILVNDTVKGTTRDRILMISTNEKLVREFKERNDEYDCWTILSHKL